MQPYHLEYAASDNPTQHDGEGPKWTDIVVAVFTIVLACVGGISGYIAYLQWGALKDQVRNLEDAVKAEKAASIERATETARALKIAEDHAKAALEQAEASKKSAEAADLAAQAAVGTDIAIVFIENVENANTNGTPEEQIREFRPKITIRNFGKTPAFITQIVCCGWIGSLPLVPNYTVFDTTQDPKVLEAGKSHTHIEWSYRHPDILTNDAIKEWLADGPNYFRVIGYVAYDDFLRKPHRVAFSWFWPFSTGHFLRSPVKNAYNEQN